VILCGKSCKAASLQKFCAMHNEFYCDATKRNIYSRRA
jgi:hypothetical protein